MKQIKFYSMVTVILAASIFTQYAIAVPNTSQSNTLQFSSIENPQPEDDGQEDTDGGDDQCELMFPFCEANLD